jgi:hypothetical protein
LSKQGFLSSFIDSTYELKDFDLFGSFVDICGITPLDQLSKLASLKQFEDSDSDYHFPIMSPYKGLFHFFSSFSSSSILNFFSLIRSPTLDNTSIFNLFNWDDSEWTSEDRPNCFFSFKVHSKYTFQLEGYRIRSSNNYFPKSWVVMGIQRNQPDELIQKIKSQLSEFDRANTKYELAYDAYHNQGIEFEKLTD